MAEQNAGWVEEIKTYPGTITFMDGLDVLRELVGTEVGRVLVDGVNHGRGILRIVRAGRADLALDGLDQRRNLRLARHVRQARRHGG